MGKDIRIVDLRHSYVSKKDAVIEALGGLTFSVHEGEVVCVIGPTGSGKTTMLRILAGLQPGYSGTVEVPTEGSADRLPVTVVFQEDSVLPWLRVRDNVALGLSGLKLSRDVVRERVERYLTLVGLGDFQSAYPHELSGGMRQRVAIARALAPEPVLLLMDEPLSSLDAQTRIVMQSELLRIVERTSSTVLYITHDVEEAVSLGDRVLVLTTRPATVKEDIETPWRALGGKSAMDLLAYRAQPAVVDLVTRLSMLLRAEVGDSLAGREERENALV